MLRTATSCMFLQLETGAFAFEEALRLVWPRSVRTAYGMLGCMQNAEDVVQDACLIAYRKRRTLRDPALFNAWFMKIVVRKAYAESRKLRCVAQAPVPVSDLDVSTLVDLRRALDSLGPKLRAAVVLCDVMRYTSEEAADFLGCPASTVRNRLFRGRRALAVTLADYAPTNTRSSRCAL